MGRMIRIFINCLSFSLLLPACDFFPTDASQKPIAVDFNLKKKSKPRNQKLATSDKLFVAVSAMISPKETFNHYESLIRYISEKIEMPIEFKQRKTYQEVNKLLESGQLDFAFVCSGAYVFAQRNQSIELLVAPVVDGQPLYYSYIITQASSVINTFDDLRGKSFAFTDPLSNTGKFYPTQLIAEKGLTPGSYFSKNIYTYAHDYSIQAVSRNLVDGAAVESLIFNFLKKTAPERVANVKIIAKSEGFGIPPVVVPKSLSFERKIKLQNIFLNMDKNETGKKILEQLQIERFIKTDDAQYNSVRAMLGANGL